MALSQPSFMTSSDLLKQQKAPRKVSIISMSEDVYQKVILPESVQIMESNPNFESESQDTTTSPTPTSPTSPPIKRGVPPNGVPPNRPPMRTNPPPTRSPPIRGPARTMRGPPRPFNPNVDNNKMTLKNGQSEYARIKPNTPAVKPGPKDMYSNLPEINPAVKPGPKDLYSNLPEINPAVKPGPKDLYSNLPEINKPKPYSNILEVGIVKPQTSYTSIPDGPIPKFSIGVLSTPKPENDTYSRINMNKLISTPTTPGFDLDSYGSIPEPEPSELNRENYGLIPEPESSTNTSESSELNRENYGLIPEPETPNMYGPIPLTTQNETRTIIPKTELQTIKIAPAVRPPKQTETYGVIPLRNGNAVPAFRGKAPPKLN